MSFDGYLSLKENALFLLVGTPVYVFHDRTICIPKTRFRIIWIIVKDQYTCLEETCGFLARNPILKEPKTIAPNCDFSLHKHIPLFYMPVSDEIIDMVLIEGCILFCELFISTVLKLNSDIYYVCFFYNTNFMWSHFDIFCNSLTFTFHTDTNDQIVKWIFAITMNRKCTICHGKIKRVL